MTARNDKEFDVVHFHVNLISDQKTSTLILRSNDETHDFHCNHKFVP